MGNVKLRVLVSLALVSAGSLLANDLQQLANTLQVASPAAGDKKLELPRVKGAKVRLLGADYEQIIGSSAIIVE